MQGGNQRCQAILGCSGASTPHCSKIPSGKKGSAGAARAQTPALLRMLNLGSAMQEEARRGFAGDGSLCTQNFWLDFFFWAVGSKQENSQGAAALGLNPAAALPWLVPPGRKKTEKESRKCCKKKKGFRHCSVSGVDEEGARFSFKAIKLYYVWREIFITLSLFLFRSLRYSEIFGVFLSKIRLTKLILRMKNLLPSSYQCTGKRGWGWKLWQQQTLQQLFIFKLIYVKGLEDKNSLQCSFFYAERKISLIKIISETFLELAEKSQDHQGCEKPSGAICEVPAKPLEFAASHFRRSLLFAEL